MASAESAASAVETASSETASDTTSEETASEEAAEDADAPQPASSAADSARDKISAESFFMWKFPLYVQIKLPRRESCAVAIIHGYREKCKWGVAALQGAASPTPRRGLPQQPMDGEATQTAAA